MSAPDTIVLIRHGEKPGDDGPPHGVNHHGEKDDHSLSVRGWTRAGALAVVFAHAPHPASPVATRPTRLYATKSSHLARSTRERDTARPTAQRLGLQVDDSVAHGHEDELVARVLEGDGGVVVVWHHGVMPKLARSFPLANPEDVPAEWPDERYDLYWILSRLPGDGQPTYQFSEVAQSLLDGDVEGHLPGDPE